MHLIELLQTKSLLIEDHDSALIAATTYENGGGFTDAFLGETNRKFGCDNIVTFDRKAARNPRFRLL